ncbi:18583_t:CDS:2 [Funneliformis geosporum]|uniref:9320_t:CDS:1 n=1 Tax=Funneliformis geosporum TaxID=1117311 RepID=A0A9W4SLL2_9GLOM|nr:18583_t:CDS:2 [Funneliformis geosporum]CAI2173772.1 9320_t:CDS:2 [Funneliformis geosporum]
MFCSQSSFELFKISDIVYILFLTIILYVAKFYYKYFTRLNPLPGPIPLPIFGNVLNKSGEFDEWMLKLHEKYGDIFEITMLGQRRVVLCRGEYVENMMKSSTKSVYLQRFPLIKDLEDLNIFGTGVINNHKINSWKYNRKFFTQAILSPSFADEALDWSHKLFYEMEDYWKGIGFDTPTDYSAWMHRFTNDMIVVLITGKRIYSLPYYYNTLSEKKSDIPITLIEDSEKFIESIQMFTIGFAFFIFTPAMVRRYLPYFKQRQNQLFKKRDYFLNKIDKIIKKRREEIEKTPLEKPLRHDMLTSFIIANTPRDINKTKIAEEEFLRPMSDEEIGANIRDAFIGGTDTTANSLCFIAYYLENYPEVKENFHQELCRVFGNDTTRRVTHEDLDKLEYTEAVIYEVSRLKPVINMLSRYSNGPDEIAGYKWPKNTLFNVSFTAINNHKAHWKDPEKFDPERFLKKDEKRLKATFNIWGGGLRICPGRKLAMIELKFLLASIYRKYDVELVNKNEPLKSKSTSLTVCQELMVRIKPRYRNHE